MTQPQESHASQGLRRLEQELARDLTLLNYPPENWVVPRSGPDGEPLTDVAIVGGGMCGLTASFALLRDGVTEQRIVDASAAGREGPWVTSARMRTLRSPKHLTGPALGLPRLTFRAWFESQWGPDAWQALDRIEREQWMAYLRWYRQVLRLPVENDTRVLRIAPAEHGFSLTLAGPHGGSVLHARKVVLATGREGIARARIPKPFESFMGGLCHHTADHIDFDALADRRVVVIGVGASALDNAACALESGARSVQVLARAKAMPRINKAKGIVYPGFTYGYPKLPDAKRLALLSYIAACRVAPPRSALLRVARFENFSLSLDARVHCVSQASGALRLETSLGEVLADNVILGTGFRIELDATPELDELAPHILRWRDRPSMASVDPDEEFLDFPYLSDSLQFQPRVPGQAPWLENLYCFNLAAQLSHGYVSSDIPAVSDGAQRLARGVCRDLFLADVAEHESALHAFVDPELLGDEFPLEDWWPPL